MPRLVRLPPGKLILWSVLALPAVAMLLDLAGEPEPWLADFVATSGLWSARLLIVALCLTPLQQLLGHRGWLAWLLRHRRGIGVAAFLYTLLHVGLYAIDIGAVAAIADEATAPSMIAGWLAFAAMLVPALISTDGAMRALGSGWKRLQRFAYPAAVLTLVHWGLVHDGLSEALLHVLPLALLEGARIAKMFTKQRMYA